MHARATKAEILGVKVAVCSINDLKAMKRAAGRTRDLADLEDLDAASRVTESATSAEFEAEFGPVQPPDGEG